MKAHWREVGCDFAECPLDPDFAEYVALNEAGRYRLWVARADEQLVGYIGWFVQAHLQFKTTLHATADAYCLDAAHRQGMNGYRMIAWSIDGLRELGVKRIVFGFPLETDLRQILTRLGFAHREEVWIKSL